MWPRSAGSGALPNLIIIGAMKCGTTSLHYYLKQHPQIWMSRQKELHFFVEERNWPKGVEWYRSHFKAGARIRGEASPAYTGHPFVVGAPERMHAVVPDAKLIYLVRDPIERIVSHYVHARFHGLESRPIDEALQDFEANRYVSRSQYAMQLAQYLKYFPAERILVLAREDLDRHRVETLQRVFRFLGVDERVRSWKFFRLLHRSDRKRPMNRLGAALARTPVMALVDRLPHNARWLMVYPISRAPIRPVLDEPLRAALAAYLKDDVERLRALTGLSFPAWSL